jgi:hypothetical protein
MFGDEPQMDNMPFCSMVAASTNMVADDMSFFFIFSSCFFFSSQFHDMML